MNPEQSNPAGNDAPEPTISPEPLPSNQENVSQIPISTPESLVSPSRPIQPQLAPAGVAGEVSSEGEKNYIVAVAFSYFFGTFGVDRFYLGYIGTGVLKLLTLGGLGIWYLIDLFRIIWGKQKDHEGKSLEGFAKHSKAFKMVFWVLLLINALFIAGWIFLVVLMSVPALQENAQETQQQQLEFESSFE